LRLSAAISPCPNDVFIFAGLILGAVKRPGWDIDFEFHELETLNRGALRGRWDAAKISYANYRNCAARYSLLRCGGALGRGCGPLLLSNGAPWDPGAEVLVPGEHTTANFLLDSFHAAGGSARPLRKAFLPFDELYRRLLGPEPCQGVVIHEMRFTYAADGLALIRDLGAHWEETTGHAIPLGALALRSDLIRAAPDLAGDLEELVRASLDWARANAGEALALCRRHAQSMAEDVLRSHIDLYVTDFTRDLGADGDAAVRHFLALQEAFRSGPATP
jgi:1,4-dihydroxy-6-naphthoate synthase